VPPHPCMILGDVQGGRRPFVEIQWIVQWLAYVCYCKCAGVGGTR